MMIEAFTHRPVSEIAEHPRGCCAAARAWLLAAAAGHGRSVAWVGEHIDWAPSTWPVYWCELLQEPAGDCGVQAAVAEFALQAAGAEVRRAQLILRCGPQEIAQWGGMWERSPSETQWIDGSLCYHEAVAVGTDEVRILDATEAVTWTSPADGLVALCLNGPRGERVRWGEWILELGCWHRLDASED